MSWRLIQRFTWPCTYAAEIGWSYLHDPTTDNAENKNKKELYICVKSGFNVGGGEKIQLVRIALLQKFHNPLNYVHIEKKIKPYT